MKKLTQIIGLIGLAILLVGIPTGCTKTTLSPNGVYHGDTFLYQSEKVIVGAHQSFQTFLQWELEYRAILPVEVSRAADVIRLNERKWIDTANALHDAYVASPTPENKDKFQLALNIIGAGLDEAAKYLSKNKSSAPISGLSTR